MRKRWMTWNKLDVTVDCLTLPIQYRRSPIDGELVYLHASINGMRYGDLQIDIYLVIKNRKLPAKYVEPYW